MSSTIYWSIYKTFNDPPGRQGLKCIKCRYATAGASAVVGVAGAYGVKKTYYANVFTGMGFVFLSLLGFGTAAVALRMAEQDSAWNEKKIQETMERLSRERQEFRKANQLPGKK